MISNKNAWDMRLHGYILPVGELAKYENLRTAEIAQRQHELNQEFDKLDKELKQLADQEQP